MESKQISPLIGIIGVCASGKTTLIAGLSARGYNCRHIAQEHSYVADMWKRITDPDILIFLEVAYETTLLRKNLNWTLKEYQEQVYRVRNAYEKADIHIKTDNMSPGQLIDEAVNQIQHLLNKNLA
jgi:molybdopterin-guanine dinucleotide biosynthesis protein